MKTKMKISRTFEIAEINKELNPNKHVLSVKRNGVWEGYTNDDFINYRDEFSMGLMALGIKKGDKILTISNNRPEWNFIDMGISQIGAVHVPVYPNMGKGDYDFIIEHSDAKLVFAGQKDHYLRIAPSALAEENVQNIYSMDKLPEIDNWMKVVELGRAKRDELYNQLLEIRDGISTDDLMTIIYTSGTTGRPKGVMLSHANFIANIDGTRDLINVVEGEKYLSFLPLCHVLERMVNYLVIYKGTTVYYAESIETIGENLKEINPHGFTAVPRILEKFYDKIIIKGSDLDGVKKKLFFWAVDLALEYKEDGKNSSIYKMKHKIADKLIFSKWREALGGNIKIIISGGAALQERLSRSFNCAGLMVAEGYGMTETSPVISVNYEGKGNMLFGSVGPIIDNVKVRFEEDGEICMQGPSQMMGYYKDPEKTAEIIDKEGWLHTGDIGELVGDRGLLKITDRKKEIFKLSTGKYVAPQVLENRAKESPFIDQILIVGEGEKFTAAIISPDFEYLHNWASDKHIEFRNNEILISKQKVVERMQVEVDKINKDIGKSRQIRKWALTCRNWTPDTGELSPTLKLKRKFLKKKYTSKLDYLYGYSDDLGNLGIRKKEPSSNE
ncbi:MAG: long-chain fatty acid--CoA ligase [Bacteroidales bacterium]|nr:long-chain fatty acid--CoA ligase [Bacteroidales bacterium]